MASETPLMGVVSRLVVQKGFDLMFDTLPEVLATPLPEPWRDPEQGV